MSLGVYEQNSIVDDVCVDNWTGEWAINASKVNSVLVDDWTAELAIIATVVMWIVSV